MGVGSPCIARVSGPLGFDNHTFTTLFSSDYVLLAVGYGVKPSEAVTKGRRLGNSIINAERQRGKCVVFALNLRWVCGRRLGRRFVKDIYFPCKNIFQIFGKSISGFGIFLL